MGAMASATRRERGLAVALACFHALCFRPPSPYHGPKEIFGQDSVYLLRALTNGAPYRYNAPHHILYHALASWLYRLCRSGPPTPAGAFLFLKVFTAAGGLAFLFAFLHLLREIGLRPERRFRLLALAGFSVPVWFNFAAFETHGLPLWAYAVFLAAAARLARRRPLGARWLIALAGALAFAILARVDAARLLLLGGALLLAPTLRGRRAALAAALAAALFAGAAGTVLLTGAYTGKGWTGAAAAIGHRQENRGLRPKMKRLGNVAHLDSMVRAAAVYGVLMPVGRHHFTEPLRKMTARPLPLLALAALLSLWARAIVPLARGLRGGDPFLWTCALGWWGSIVFFTWLDPFEPFLWILEPLVFALAAWAWLLRGAGRWTWHLVTAVAILAAAHNVLHFWLPFDR
jgi:hypothetical protein